ncbi:MAG: hypothetical protein QXQ91_03745 [Nanopusillaceae archaeon]
MQGVTVQSIVSRLSRYFQLSEDEALDLYDELDTLYNELKARFLEALVYPDKNRELVDRIFDMVSKLLMKESRTLEEDLLLIALLDILSTDLHDRTIGLVEEEQEE